MLDVFKVLRETKESIRNAGYLGVFFTQDKNWMEIKR